MTTQQTAPLTVLRPPPVFARLPPVFARFPSASFAANEAVDAAPVVANADDTCADDEDVDARASSTLDFFDAHLIECLGCGGVYRKLAPARYVKEGRDDDGDDDGEERLFRRRPCAKCGTGEHCVEWRGWRGGRGRTRVERTFPFAAGMVVAGGTRGDAR